MGVSLSDGGVLFSFRTSSPSSSTTGFTTLILLSEAIVRIWKKFTEGVDPDQQDAKVLLERREGE